MTAYAYYPPENTPSIIACDIPIYSNSAWVVGIQNPKLDLLVNEKMLRKVILQDMTTAAPGYLDLPYEVASGMMTREEYDAKHAVVPTPVVEVNSTTTQEDPQLNLLDILNAKAEAMSKDIGDTAVKLNEVLSNTSELLSDTKKSDLEANPITHTQDSIKELSDSEVEAIAKTHGIDVVDRNSRRMQLNDLTKLGIVK